MTSEAPRSTTEERLLRITGILGEIFVPLMPAIVAASLLTSLTEGLNSALGSSLSMSSWWILLHVASNASLVFLQILIGFSAARTFGGNEFLGGMIGMVTNHTSLINAWAIPEAIQRLGSAAYQIVGSSAAAEWLSMMTGTPVAAADSSAQAIIDAGGIPQVSLIPNVLDVTLQGYQGHVLVVVIAVYVMCKIEAWLHARVPDMLDLFITPLVTVLATGLATMVLIGPVFTMTQEWVLSFFQFLLSIPYGVGNALVAALYPVTTILGVHHLFNAFEASMCASSSPNDILNPLISVSHMAQAGACLAVFAKTRSNKQRNLALPAFLSALLGGVEPAIYGVTLPTLKPFVAAMAGAAVGGALASVHGVHSVAFGTTGLFDYLFVSDIAVFSAMIGVAFLVSYGTTLVLFQNEDEAVEEMPEGAAFEGEAEPEAEADEPKEESKSAPKKPKTKTEAKLVSKKAKAEVETEASEASSKIKDGLGDGDELASRGSEANDSETEPESEEPHEASEGSDEAEMESESTSADEPDNGHEDKPQAEEEPEAKEDSGVDTEAQGESEAGLEASDGSEPTSET